MHIYRDSDLTTFNTLKLSSRASWYASVASVADIKDADEFASQREKPLMVLGGGSNVLLPPYIDALVVKPGWLGIESEINDHSVRLRVGAAENWHKLVEYTVCQGWRGLENLALIPGTVGAAPVQNIGAYGVELESVVAMVECFDRSAGGVVRLNRKACRFGYRDSIFKQFPNRYIIMWVELTLDQSAPLTLTYRGVKERLPDPVGATPSDVFDAIVSLRQAKLPDPEMTPNAGSFFKNPILPIDQVEKLRESFPSMPTYQAEGDKAKVAAGWLIDQAGWRGRVAGALGVHDKQALVLVNHGSAELGDLLALANAIREDIKSKFGISLEIEPTIPVRA